MRHRIDALHNRPSALVAGDKAYRFQTRLPTPFDQDSKRLEAAHDAIGLTHEQKEAERLLDAGKWKEAEALLRAAIAEQWNPDLADMLAEVELTHGHPAGAAALLQEAVDRAGANPYLLYRLGSAYEEAGQPDRAVAAWSRATTLGIGAEVKDSYYRLAAAYEQAKKPEAARVMSARAFFNVSHEFVTSGRAAEALLPLEEATKADPQLAAAWFYRGEAHRLAGRADAARAAYQKCLELAPNQGRARRGVERCSTWGHETDAGPAGHSPDGSVDAGLAGLRGATFRTHASGGLGEGKEWCRSTTRTTRELAALPK